MFVQDHFFSRERHDCKNVASVAHYLWYCSFVSSFHERFKVCVIEIAFIASVKLHLLHGYDCIKFKQRSFLQLRTQALASLHGSLQNNQGIPVTHIMSWLGLEVNAIFYLFC